MVLVKISFLNFVSVFVFASKKHPENDKMNGKLNIVGINTYVYRFEMLWLSLLDHFLFLSLSLFVCVYVCRFYSVSFYIFDILASNYVRLSISFDILVLVFILSSHRLGHLVQCICAFCFFFVFAFFSENILATWGFFFVAFVSYIICAFENVFKHTATTKRTIIVEIVFHSVRQTLWANCAFQPCLFRWIINILFIVFDTKSFFG